MLVKQVSPANYKRAKLPSLAIFMSRINFINTLSVVATLIWTHKFSKFIGKPLPARNSNSTKIHRRSKQKTRGGGFHVESKSTSGWLTLGAANSVVTNGHRSSSGDDVVATCLRLQRMQETSETGEYAAVHKIRPSQGAQWWPVMDPPTVKCQTLLVRWWCTGPNRNIDRVCTTLLPFLRR